jgi:hypothetical protein
LFRYENTEFRNPLREIHDQNHESMLLKNWGHSKRSKILEAGIIMQGESWRDGVPRLSCKATIVLGAKVVLVVRSVRVLVGGYPIGDYHQSMVAMVIHGVILIGRYLDDIELPTKSDRRTAVRTQT